MFSTPDLKDKYQKKVFQGFESMKSFGNRDSFFGQIKLFSVFNNLDLQSGGNFYFVPQKNIKDYE